MDPYLTSLEPRVLVREEVDDLVPSDRLLELLPDAVYACDRDGFIVRYNRAAAELWGRTPRLGHPADRFCGSLRLYRLDGGPLSHAECPMADVLSTGVPVRNGEIVMERPDGSRIVALVNIEALRDSSGKIVGAVNCFRDITEQRRRWALGRQSERAVSDLLGALPAAVYTTDAAGRITYYNEAAAELWGCRPELGRSEFCGSWKLYWPDGTPLPHDECPMALALKEGRPIRGMEAVAERPDGSRVRFLAYPTPLLDASGTLVGAVNMLVDVTERRTTDDAARQLASIVESSDDAIISKDLDGIITSWNKSAERLYGYTADEVVGKPVTILMPPDRVDEEPVILERLRRGERVDHYETVRKRKDGGLLDISLTVSPVRDAEGRIVGASKIARDITERRRAQERQALLLREMNHRIKNLFTLASGVVALSARSTEGSHEFVDAVRERLVALARAHDLTLPEIGEGRRAEKPTTLEALVRTVVAPYDDPASPTRVRVKGPAVAVGGGAVTSLALLIHEFATNAAKFGALSTVRGRVEIGWKVRDGELTFTWTERGGPVVAGPPRDEGFGSLLARVAVKGQLGGRIVPEWKPTGLVIRLFLPIDRLAQ